jgi:hypothetical protein
MSLVYAATRSTSFWMAASALKRMLTALLQKLNADR